MRSKDFRLREALNEYEFVITVRKDCRGIRFKEGMYKLYEVEQRPFDTRVSIDIAHRSDDILRIKICRLKKVFLSLVPQERFFQ